MGNSAKRARDKQIAKRKKLIKNKRVNEINKVIAAHRKEKSNK